MQLFLENYSLLMQGRVKKCLSKLYRFDGVVLSVLDRINKLHSEGNLTVTTYEEGKIKPMSRRQFFRATENEQNQHAKKMAQAGNKTVYLVGESDLGKIAYDYACFLLQNKKQKLEQN